MKWRAVIEGNDLKYLQQICPTITNVVTRAKIAAYLRCKRLVEFDGPDDLPSVVRENKILDRIQLTENKVERRRID